MNSERTFHQILLSLNLNFIQKHSLQICTVHIYESFFNYNPTLKEKRIFLWMFNFEYCCSRARYVIEALDYSSNTRLYLEIPLNVNFRLVLFSYESVLSKTFNMKYRLLFLSSKPNYRSFGLFHYFEVRFYHSFGYEI